MIETAKASIASSSGTKIILQAMHQNLSNEGILLDGLVTLWNLKDTTRGRREASKSRATAIIAEAVDQFPGNEKIQSYGSQLIRFYQNRPEHGGCFEMFSCIVVEECTEGLWR
jgi:hypothetical protein